MLALLSLSLLFAGCIDAHDGHDHGSSTATSPSQPLSNFTNPLEAVFATPSLSYLQYAILVSGLEGSFVAPNTTYTILAPNNDAWSRTNGVDFLKSQRLGGILAFHVIPKALTTSDLKNGTTLDTLWGLSMKVTGSGTNLTFSGATNGATIVVPNIRAGKNIIHIVDNILDRRSNAAILTSEANATLAKINYNTMLQYPAASPSSTQTLATAG